MICRKLRLKRGDRFLDIGCGWGGLIRYAAKNWGVQATGVTLSKNQVEWANKKIAESGLKDRCKVELMDYRDITGLQRFDKISTIEAMEHFGARQFDTYFKKCWDLLSPLAYCSSSRFL